jgi:hypothetical protein
MTPQNQEIKVLQQRACRILSAWAQGRWEELQSLIERPTEFPNSVHAREYTEAIGAVVVLLRVWLSAPEEVSIPQLQAASGLLRHLAGTI